MEFRVRIFEPDQPRLALVVGASDPASSSRISRPDTFALFDGQPGQPADRHASLGNEAGVAK
jgi:hypothetical protein